MFTVAAHLASRLSEVEKIQIRMASPGTLDWLFYNIYRYEIDLPVDQAVKLFLEVKDIVVKKFIEGSASKEFGRTWDF